ncbi:MAG TPA: hypothetical protein VF718_09845 [Allosphingosinicella sp.]|jgi:hypothetical protein
MTEESPASGPSAHFKSLSELQTEHLQLMEASDNFDQRLPHEGEPVDQEPSPEKAKALRTELLRLRRAATRFVRRARATGVALDDAGERAVAQSALDFWHVRSAYMARDAERLRLLQTNVSRRLAKPIGTRVMLDKFDEAAAPELTENQCPFVGLRAFGEEQAREGAYCGREDAVAELLKKVQEQRLTIVYGPSGSGKSSLVVAGLVPALRTAAGSEALTVWPVVTPGTDPLGALLQSVRPAGREAAPWVADGRAKLAANPAYLSDLAADASGGGAGLLIVDQAEELVLMGSATTEREAFAAAVAALASSVQPEHRVIVVAREDFVGRLREIPGFAALPDEAAIAFRPKPMTPAELRMAIEGPARKPGLKFEPGIIDDLVREVADDPAALPLLQFTLMQLWNGRRRNLIRREVYEKVGRPGEALGRVAESIFEELGSVQNQQAAKEIFLTLVVPGVGNEVVRRRVRLETLRSLRDPGLIDRVLKPFVEAGLVRHTEGVERDDDRYEVMHEALLRNWPRLGTWVREVRDQEQDHLLVLNSARIWDKNGRSADHLAVGDAIAHADRFAGKDELIAAYVAASRANEAEKAGYATTVRRRVIGGGSTLIALLVAAIVIGLWIRSEWKQQALQAELDARMAERAALADRYDLEAQAARLAAPAPANEIPVEQLESHRSVSRFGPGNEGWMWAGSDRSPLLQDWQSQRPVPPSSLRTGERYRPRFDISLRSGLPDEKYVSTPSIGLAPRGALLIATGPVRTYDRPSGRQYWARVRLVPRVFIHSVAGTAERAERLRDKLAAAGFEVPPYQLLRSAAAKSEVRYFFDQDRQGARDLAKLIEPEIRNPVAVKKVKSPSAVVNNPEVWVDLSQAGRPRPAEQPASPAQPRATERRPADPQRPTEEVIVAEPETDATGARRAPPTRDLPAARRKRE